VPLAPEPTSAPLAGAMPPPAASTTKSAAAPVAAPIAAFGTPPRADALATIGSPGSERGLAVATEAVPSAPDVRGSPVSVSIPTVSTAGLGALAALTAAAHASWAETFETLARRASEALDAAQVATSAPLGGADNGGTVPLPVGPATAPSPAGSSGGFGGDEWDLLGVLALLFALSPLGVKLLHSVRDFPRPNSALVLVTERPG
jgi:hypothetical protein